jgi:hypothetical protein
MFGNVTVTFADKVPPPVKPVPAITCIVLSTFDPESDVNWD